MTKMLALITLPVVLISFFAAESATRALASPRQFGGTTRSVNGSVVLQGTAHDPVRITIDSPGRAFHRIVYTDSSGSFSVSGIPIGVYDVQLEAEGYQTQHETLDVPPGTGMLQGKE